MDYLNNVEFVSSGKEDITIQKKNDTIHFRSQGKLKIFDSLVIDMRENVIIYSKYNLTFSDTDNITNNKNGLKSKWKGYTWKFEEPKNLGAEQLKDPSTLTMKQYECTIGRLEKNGKSFINIKGREVENGVKTVEFELPIIF